MEPRSGNPVNPQDRFASLPRIEDSLRDDNLYSQIQFAFLWRNLRWLRLFFCNDTAA